MEFKFRGTNKAPPPYPHNHHDMSHFVAEQALRVGYPDPDMVHMGQFFPDPSITQESVLRELEKQKIRERLLAEEVEQRRDLEAEVRREMMLERELSLRGVCARDSSLFLGMKSSYPLNSRLSILDHSQGRLVEPMPFNRISAPKITEVKSSPKVPRGNRERIILLPKPEENVPGLKQQVLPSANSIKKPKELHCALCQVSATSEIAMKDHLRGKKHKLASQIAGKDFTIGLFSRKNSNNAKEETQVQEEKQKEVVVEEKLKEIRGTKFEFWCSLCKVGASSEKIMNDHKKGKKHKSRICPREEEASKKENNVKTVSEKEVKDVDNNCKKDGIKFEFWCSLCKIGAFSEEVMNKHKMGKKHKARILETLCAPKEEASEKENDKQTVGKKKVSRRRNKELENKA